MPQSTTQKLTYQRQLHARDPGGRFVIVNENGEGPGMPWMSASSMMIDADPEG
jgi:hypothetical protein